MKNFLIVFIISLLLSTTNFAQTNLVKFKAGPAHETPRTEQIGLVGNADLGIVDLTTRRGKLILTGFNPKSLSESNQQEEELNKERNFNSDFLANMSGKFYWINSNWDKQAEKEKLYAAEIDPKTCKLKEQVLILEASKMAGDQLAGGVMLAASKTVGKYNFNYSADRKLLLVSYRLIPESRIDKNNNDKIGLVVYDVNMKKLWGHEFVMPYTTARMDTPELSIDNSGNVYMLSKIYQTDRRKENENGQPGFHYELFAFSDGSNSIKIIPVNMENYVFGNSKFVEGINGKHFIVTTCTKTGSDKGIDGFYIMTINANGNLEKFNNGFYELPFDELAKFESTKIKRRTKSATEYGYKIRSFVIQEDGGFFISGEDYTYISTSTKSGFSSQWYFDNITAMKFSADGKFEWARQIRKQQENIAWNISGELKGESSYLPFADETGYYFMFVDNTDNFNIKETEEPKIIREGDEGNLVVIKMDQQGKLSKQLLYTKDKGEKITPTEFLSLTPRQFAVKSWKNSKEFVPILISTL